MVIVLSTEGTTHSVRHEEEAAFADWINTNLGHDKDLEHLLPVDAKNLYQKITDGILLSWVVYVSIVVQSTLGLETTLRQRGRGF